MQWVANPINDMYADAIVAAILQADLLDTPIKNTSTNAKVDRMHFKVVDVIIMKLENVNLFIVFNLGMSD